MINTGGPAFPSMRDMRNDPDFDTEQGITLLEHYAALAMQAQIAGGAVSPNCPVDRQIIARRSFEMAVAMLEERREWIE